MAGKVLDEVKVIDEDETDSVANWRKINQKNIENSRLNRETALF